MSEDLKPQNKNFGYNLLYSLFENNQQLLGTPWVWIGGVDSSSTHSSLH